MPGKGHELAGVSSSKFRQVLKAAAEEDHRKREGKKEGAGGSPNGSQEYPSLALNREGAGA